MEARDGCGAICERIAEGWWDNGCPSGIFRLRESGDLGELPVEQQLAVEVELQRLADRGYREDRALWVYQHLLRKCGMWPQNARVPLECS